VRMLVRARVVCVCGWVGVRVLFVRVFGFWFVRTRVHMCVSARPKP
jgi:hypothetical protein